MASFRRRVVDQSRSLRARFVCGVLAALAALAVTSEPGAVAEEDGASPPAQDARTLISVAALIDAAHKDLAALPPAARASVRYISLAELWNAGAAAADMDQTRWAVVKLLNSLSWAPAMHVPVDVMEPRGRLFRIDLRAIAWAPERWQALTSPWYPYQRTLGTSAEAEVRAWTGTQVPCVRGDWLVAAASKAPLYYALVTPPDDPHAMTSEFRLARRLGASGDGAGRDGVILRGGTKAGDSAVFRRDRVFERRALPQGVLWQTFDFLPGNKEGNPVALPLGPERIGISSGFEHDVSELSFSLPNGLTGFLALKWGNPVEVIPQSLLVPKCKPVNAAASCFGCHSAGVHGQIDTLTAVIRKEHASRPEVLEKVDRLYRPDDLARAVADDRARYVAAIRGAGLPASAADAGADPISATIRRFQAPLSATQAAAELGLPDAAEFLRRAASPLGPLADELRSGKVPTLSRAAFESVVATEAGTDPAATGTTPLPPAEVKALLTDLAQWDAASAEARRGVAQAVAAQATGFRFLRMETFSCGGQTHEIAVFLHEGTQLEFVLVPVGTFVMGTASQAAERWHENWDQVKSREGWETPHDVCLTKPFLIARTECTQAAYDRVMVKDPRARSDSTLPVCETWNEAAEFCRRAALVLPTEAQWEWACRAGTRTAFCFGPTPDQLRDYAWFAPDPAPLSRPRVVALGKPNAFGLFDVHGNEREACQDGFRRWTQAAQTDPVGAGSERVARGGDFSETHGDFLRSVTREPTSATAGSVGIRPAWVVRLD